MHVLTLLPALAAPLQQQGTLMAAAATGGSVAATQHVHDSSPVSDTMNMSGPAAPMETWFHFTTDVTGMHLLFYGWQPTNTTTYLLSLVVLFCLTLLAEWLTYAAPKLLVAPLDPKLSKEPPTMAAMLKHRAMLFLLAVVRITLGFFAMLGVMSYDLGIFITVTFGLSLGYAIWAEPQWFYGHAHDLGGPALSARADHTH